jgi:uncharacterized protein
MTRLDQILNHPCFLACMEEIEEFERERIFCRHDMEHLLTTARLMLIYTQQDGVQIPRDVLYAAALLHDIGRGAQYRDGTPHDEASVQLAEPILQDCGYSEGEQQLILAAISGHRKPGEGSELAKALYWADKKSRPCYSCSAERECNWPTEKKNLSLEY